MSSSRLAKRVSAFFIALLGGLAVTLAPTTAASAHPTVTYLYCESGASTYICDLAYTGAHEPATIQWFFDGAHRSAHDGMTFARGGCTLNKFYQVTVNVTDIHGTATESTGFVCRKIWQ